MDMSILDKIMSEKTASAEDAKSALDLIKGVGPKASVTRSAISLIDFPVFYLKITSPWDEVENPMLHFNRECNAGSYLYLSDAEYQVLKSYVEFLASLFCGKDSISVEDLVYRMNDIYFSMKNQFDLYGSIVDGVSLVRGIGNYVELLLATEKTDA